MKHKAANALSSLLPCGTDTTLLKGDLQLLRMDALESIDTVIRFVDKISNAISLPDTENIPLDTPHSKADTPNTPTIDESTCERTKDAFGSTMAFQVRQHDTKFHINHDVLLVLQSTIDGPMQIIVPTPLQQLILTHAQYF